MLRTAIACVSTWFIGLATVASLGCSNGLGRVPQSDYSASAGADAVKSYDDDGDGAIGGTEFDQVPSLRAALAQVDTNGDKRVTAQEIDVRIQKWRDTQVAEMAVTCQVLLDGSPLANADVVFEPEAFLGPDVKPAMFKTSQHGAGSVSMAQEFLADPSYPGMACGFYKVRVLSEVDDIPSRYNQGTTLGCEVAMDAHWTNQPTVKFELTSD